MSKLFERIPNWITVPGGLGGLLLSAFAFRFPSEYRGIGLYVGLGLTALCVVLFLVHVLRQRGRTKKTVSVSAHLETGRWHEDWHELQFRRSEFWRLINNCYGNWQSRVNENIQRVIAESSFPSALPLADNNTFSDWVWKFQKEIGSVSAGVKNADSLLDAFSSFIYEPNASERFCLGFGGARSGFEKFDSIRHDLSSFWDRWGSQENIDKTINDPRTEEILASSAAELKLLTFLEIARARWCPTEATGKRGLFYLARRANVR